MVMSDRRLQRICTFNISIAPYFDLSPPTRISTRPSGLFLIDALWDKLFLAPGR
jgi:hypothetical protein